MPEPLDTTPHGRASDGRMPVLFIGHGSPMNAIVDSDFTRTLSALPDSVPVPRAILVISAHWLTRGTRVTSTQRNTQLFDFAGFPEELSRIKYTPPGDIALAERICGLLSPDAASDPFRPIDHGCWTVLSRMYPDAGIPVLQLSIDAKAEPAALVAMASKLRSLRTRGALILASGNIVHALGALQPEPSAQVPGWVTAFDDAVAQALEHADIPSLVAWEQFPFAERAVPEPSHYLPLLYAAGLRLPDDRLTWIHTGMEYGSISLRSFMLRPDP